MNDDAWNDMSSEYDDNVEGNFDPVISDYLSEEIKITSDLCKKIIKPDVKYTVIDMGSVLVGFCLHYVQFWVLRYPIAA